jgi:hypothetical protein
MLRVAFASVLGLVSVVTTPERKSEGRAAIDEVIQPWAVSIVDTPTPPSVAHRIYVNHWEDLLRAAELLGRPILRLQGGEGGPDGSLFYVADGPQSYVFGFGGTPVNVARSGAYAPPSPPAVLPVPVEPEQQELDLSPAPLPEPALAPIAEAPPAPRAIPPPVVPDPADALLGPEISDERSQGDLPSATVVERRIREMIHELLADYRRLPASSDRLELGTEHIQRAIDMLHLGRYGVAQIELNKAARLLKEEPQS